MTKTETILISLPLAVACPLFALVAFWWGSAAASMYVAAVPVGGIKAAALAGLFVGVLGDILFLKRWVAAFYSAKWAWVAAVYVGLSVMALAFCMGMPIGTFAVGVTGGVYLGRRLRHTRASGSVVSRTLTWGALCAASLTTLLALPVGLMALHEPVVLRVAGAFGLQAGTISGPIGQASMLMICLVLFGLQFYSTRAAGILAFGIQPHNGQPAAADYHPQRRWLRR
ncbi:MAG TPA: hypothetical protein VMW24_06765 [Sedimentisphaerales bacterium]|nr:hypothetical protein [Sedimentisphaerales bacterium]